VAEFPEVVGALREAAAGLRGHVDPAHGDRLWADVLERAARVPDGLSVAETVRWVVEHSDVRIDFPDDFDPEALAHG
jgi:hypothetical protein